MWGGIANSMSKPSPLSSDFSMTEETLTFVVVWMFSAPAAAGIAGLLRSETDRLSALRAGRGSRQPPLLVKDMNCRTK